VPGIVLSAQTLASGCRLAATEAVVCRLATGARGEEATARYVGWIGGYAHQGEPSASAPNASSAALGTASAAIRERQDAIELVGVNVMDDELCGTALTPPRGQVAEAAGQLFDLDPYQDGHLGALPAGSLQLSREQRQQGLEALTEASPGVSVACRQASAGRGLTADDDARQRVRCREGVRTAELVELALVVGRTAGQQQAQYVDSLAQVLSTLRSLREGDALGVVLGGVSASADAQLEAPVRELGHGGRDAGQDGGVAIHDVGHEGAQTDA
jgi:hypothetical protein